MKLSLLSSRHFYKGQRDRTVECMDREECDTNHPCPSNPMPRLQDNRNSQSRWPLQMSPYQSSGPEVADGCEFIVRAPLENKGGAGALGRPQSCGSHSTGFLLASFLSKT